MEPTQAEIEAGKAAFERWVIRNSKPSVGIEDHLSRWQRVVAWIRNLGWKK